MFPHSRNNNYWEKNKADVTTPRSYRPIALLSVLGKHLERLITRRMTWISNKHKTLTHQQFVTFLLRSSVDLTTYFAHDIKSSLTKVHTATIAILDIKGEINALLLGRLIHRLKKQVWPLQLSQCIDSFAIERDVSICFDGETGAQYQSIVACHRALQSLRFYYSKIK